MSKQKLFFLGLGLITLIILTYYLVSTDEKKDISSTLDSNTTQTKLKIVTTLFPIYDIAKSVSNSNQVSLLLPPGVEAHSFEPTPLDIQEIGDADVFIYTGAEMEPWVEKILASIENKPMIVNVSEGITLLEIEEVSHEGEEHTEEEEDVHTEEESTNEEEKHAHDKDPHFWLDFDNTKIIVNSITTKLQEKDSQNSDLYQKNADLYKNNLTTLDQSFQNGLNACVSRSLVHGGHYAFGYLAKKYGLTYTAAQGFTPDSEPTAQDIVKLVEIVKNSNTKAVFTEELVDPKIANLISSETGVPVRAISAASNLTKNEFEQKITFFDIMRNNLNELELGLGCK